LNLSSEKPWYIKYMWYAFAGLLALLLLLITKKTIDWSKEKKASAKTEIKEKEKREAEGEKRISTFKIFLIGIIILLLLAGIIFVAIYFGSGLIHLYANQTTGTEEPSGEIQEKEDQKTETAEVLQNIPYEEINLQKGVETIIPIKITNANETSIFNIKINDNVDWISVDKDFVIIQPNQSEVINLVASPTEQVDNGVYNVIVDIAVNGKEGQYIRGFRLNVNESKRSALLSYLLYILAGIVVLCTIIYVLKSREKKVKEGRSKKEDETKEKEDKRQIKKTKISLE
ncbi:MAG: hypothetical protein N3D84_01950, partial [Candidatus Woesearchaeota archaeon]|nr:hypothetical protein [Candidatus Woesearchaeota archaeon]